MLTLSNLTQREFDHIGFVSSTVTDTEPINYPFVDIVIWQLIVDCQLIRI